MRYFLVEPTDVAHTRLKALLVVAETAEDALRYGYRVTGQSGKGIDRPAGWSRLSTLRTDLRPEGIANGQGLVCAGGLQLDHRAPYHAPCYY